MHLIDQQFCFPRQLATLLVATAALVACKEAPPPVPADTPQPEIESTCGEVGVLQGMLSGAINATLDWPDSALLCESMPRPDGEGVRIRLSGDVAGERLAIIIAMPDLDAGETGPEFDSNITVSVEGSGRFFSTPNLDTCWTSVATNKALEGNAGTHNVIGSLTCVGPLGEINGDGFVDIRDFTFSGIANWTAE